MREYTFLRKQFLDKQKKKKIRDNRREKKKSNKNIKKPKPLKQKTQKKNSKIFLVLKQQIYFK